MVAEATTMTIYHNPACGTSRNVLAMIRNSGEEPRIIEYLKTPPSRSKLLDLIVRIGITPRASCCAARARPTTSWASMTRSSPTIS
jgi:arsenate reductase (glutaredoxin)